MAIPELSIIGERINPGFRSTKAMFDNSDIAAIQELAIKQADAGAVYLNTNIGTRALDDPEFMNEVIDGIQAVEQGGVNKIMANTTEYVPEQNTDSSSYTN